MAYADDCLVLHPERAVLDHGPQRLTAGRAGIGRTLPVHQTRINPTLAGEPPGLDFLGCPLRPYRGGKPPSGRGPRGRQRLGDTTLIPPAQANLQAHLAALGRVSRAGQPWPQAALIHQLTPKRRGWANDDRPWGWQAPCGSLGSSPLGDAAFRGAQATPQHIGTVGGAPGLAPPSILPGVCHATHPSASDVPRLP
jgi:hypothetical protein